VTYRVAGTGRKGEAIQTPADRERYGLACSYIQRRLDELNVMRARTDEVNSDLVDGELQTSTKARGRGQRAIHSGSECLDPLFSSDGEDRVPRRRNDGNKLHKVAQKLLTIRDDHVNTGNGLIV
jgi:hypothetical protein